jgi:hypothetical protein
MRRTHRAARAGMGTRPTSRPALPRPSRSRGHTPDTGGSPPSLACRTSHRLASDVTSFDVVRSRACRGEGPGGRGTNRGGQPTVVHRCPRVPPDPREEAASSRRESYPQIGPRSFQGRGPWRGGWHRACGVRGLEGGGPPHDVVVELHRGEPASPRRPRPQACEILGSATATARRRTSGTDALSTPTKSSPRVATREELDATPMRSA